MNLRIAVERAESLKDIETIEDKNIIESLTCINCIQESSFLNAEQYIEKK